MPNSAQAPFSPGQKVWVHMISWRDATKLEEAAVLKVGRKWVELDPSYLGRFDVDTLLLKGESKYGSPGRVYRSPEDFHTELLTNRLWYDLARRIPIGSVPKGVTLDKIRQVAALLDIPLPE